MCLIWVRNKSQVTGMRLQIHKEIRARSGQEKLPTTTIKDINGVMIRVLELFLYKY